MALPKKGSRKIVVAGTAFRWTIRRKATEAQKEHPDACATVAVECLEGPTAKLVIRIARAHPQNYFVRSSDGVTPSAVRGWLEKCLALGWKPRGTGTTIAKEELGGAITFQKN